MIILTTMKSFCHLEQGARTRTAVATPFSGVDPRLLGPLDANGQLGLGHFWLASPEFWPVGGMLNSDLRRSITS